MELFEIRDGIYSEIPHHNIIQGIFRNSWSKSVENCTLKTTDNISWSSGKIIQQLSTKWRYFEILEEMHPEISY